MEENKNIFEDLQYIKQIINDSRNIVVENGMGFIIWGILIMSGLFYTYIDILMKGVLQNDIAWVVFVGMGWLYTIYDWLKRKGRQKVSTFAGKLLGTIWMAVGISMTILGFVGTLAGAYNGVFVSPLLATLLAIAYFASAQVNNSKMMLYIAPLWWVGAIVMFIYPGIHTLAIMAGMMLFFQVVPGIVLYKKYKLESSLNG